MMMVKGMSTVRGTLGNLAAIVALASGLALTNPARADEWKDALHDADDLHHAAEELHERALRLHDHHAMPVTAALDQAAADLYHGLRHHPCAADVVPLLNRTQAILSETSSVMALSCEMHTDRKAVALLKDVRHHFVDTAEHIQLAIHHEHDHHSHHRAHRHHHTAPAAGYYQPQPTWPSSRFGTYYSAPPAWAGQQSPPTAWGGQYRGSSYRGSHNTQRPLARVLISELLAK